jgi:hypothetical protein
MTGILLIIVASVWLWLVLVLTRSATQLFKSKGTRLFVAVVVFSLLLVAPVGDEIVGGFQFRALCEKNANFRMGVSKPEGRVTRFSISPSNEVVSGTAITIRHSGIQYTDVQTGALVLEFDRYGAKGGVFIRTLGISENNSPITMGYSSCSPEKKRGEAAHLTMKFTVIN